MFTLKGDFLTSKRLIRGVCVFLFILFGVSFLNLHGASIESESAKLATKGWLRFVGRPLDVKLSKKIASVKAIKNDKNKILCFIVSLDPEGYIIMSPDDMIEPVIAFSSSGHFIETDDNPLFSLIKEDMSGRLKTVSDEVAKQKNKLSAIPKTRTKNIKKWKKYLLLAESDEPLDGGESSVTDVRVAPLVKTKWGQETAGYNGSACYNYYTPTSSTKWEEGNSSNYPCGCVATAMAQVLRTYEYPTTGVGTDEFTVKVSGSEQKRSLLGGDKNGGPYNWNKMPVAPGRTAPEDERKAIGALTHDCAVSVGMSFSSAGSGASLTTAADSMVNTFSLSSAISAWHGQNAGSLTQDTAEFNNMVNTNLDANMPLLFGLPGHAVVCDGYGYIGNTVYHHVNLGWKGSFNAWYELPRVDTSSFVFNSVDVVVFNLYKSGTGEIISGRVLDASSNPLSGVDVTAQGGGKTYTATTNAKGIYALTNLPSSEDYTVSSNGVTPVDVHVGTSRHISWNRFSVGNKWGIDLYVAGANTSSISGTVSGDYKAGITLTLSGDANRTTTSDSSGNFSFAGLSDGDYDLTPSKSGCVFAPASRHITLSGSDSTGNDFVTTFSATLSGDVIGYALTGVKLTLKRRYSDTELASTYPDASGYYEFTGVGAGYYNIYATQEGCLFIPYDIHTGDTTLGIRQNINVSASDVGDLGFTCLLDNYGLSGTVTGAVKAGVSVKVTGNGVDRTILTDEDGGWGVGGLANGDYTITPSKRGFTFTPPSRSETIHNKDIKYRDFTAASSGGNSAPTATDDSYSLNQNSTLDVAKKDGILKNDSDPDGDTLTAVKTSDPAHGNLTFNDDGSFSYTPSNGWSGTDSFKYKADDGIEQSSEATVTLTVNSVQPSTYSISGSISGDKKDGVTLTLSGDASKTTTSASNGSYSFSNLSNGTYTVTPSLSGYTFAPASKDTTLADADATGVDFVATQDAATQFTLTVRNGTGGGQYAENDSVPISATVPAGQLFDKWAGDVQYIADTTSASTTVTMPAKDITVRARFKQAPPNTHDISGTVSGDVQQGVVVSVDSTHSATTDASGNYTISGLADGDYTVTPTLAGYTFAPASANKTLAGADVSGVDFVATQDAATQFTLTVRDGTGGGQYAENASVPISATVPAGKLFDKWAGDVQYIADTTSASTTVTMPAKDITVRARFKDAPPNSHNISGTISGDVKQGVVVSVDSTHSATTDASGNYTISGLADGDYTVTPSLTGYTFAPASANKTVAGADVSGVDFVSSRTTSSGNDPVGISGCVLWLDGADPNGDSSSVSGALSLWKDKSGSGHDAAQSDSNLQPSVSGSALNSLSVISFDGNDDALTFSQITNARTIFWVLKEQNQSSDGSSLHFLLGDNGSYDFHRGTGTLWDSTYAADGIKNGVTRVDRADFDGLTADIPADKFIIVSLQASADLTASQVTKDRDIGRTWDGGIAEIIIYDSALSDTDRDTVENYLYNKWFGGVAPSTHSITGTVSGDVKQGVTVSVDSTHSATTDASGNYTISGLADGSYTVTPTLAGYTFAPASANKTVAGADVSGVDFVATQDAASNFTLTVRNGTGGGQYPENASVTISATVPAGQLFDKWAGDVQYIADTTSASTTVTMPAKNITVRARFKQAPPNTHNISGTVSGDVKQGVTVAVDSTHSATTDASGNYTISGLADGSYTVTPTLAGYTFAPASANKTVAGADVSGVNFVATQNAVTKFTLTVRNGTGGGQYAENASVTISATVPAGQLFDKWAGDVQYIADTTSASTSVTMPAKNITVRARFKQAPPNTHNISGTVSGDVKQGVTVSVDSTHSATTDASGNYTISGLADGSYTVTPTLSGYTFTPQSKSVNISGSNTGKVDFSAKKISTPPSPAPQVQNDAYFVKAGTSLNVPVESGVLVNDSDVNGNTLSAIVESQVVHGVLSLKSDGAFTYTPNMASGTDSFTYRADNGTTKSKIATVTIKIIASGTDLPPTAVGDKYTVAQNAKLFVNADSGVLANDFPAGLKNGAVIVNSTTSGTISLTKDGSFNYTPKKDFSGVDTFTYKISGQPESNIAVVSILVIPYKVTLGSVVYIRPEIIQNFKEKVFTKMPKIYGKVNEKNMGLKKAKALSTEKCAAGAWSKKFPLYDKKAVKANYKSYFEKNGALKPLEIDVYVKLKTLDGAKLDQLVTKVQLTPPSFSEFVDSHGNAISEAAVGATVGVKGFYFGDKAPKIFLLVNDKLLKCKVDKTSMKFTNIKSKPSCMDINSGESYISFIIPSKNLEKGTYPVIINNKIGIATTPYVNDQNKGAIPLLTIK